MKFRTEKGLYEISDDDAIEFAARQASFEIVPKPKSDFLWTWEEVTKLMTDIKARIRLFFTKHLEAAEEIVTDATYDNDSYVDDYFADKEICEEW